MELLQVYLPPPSARPRTAVGGKMALLYCKYLNSSIVGNIVSFISYSSMCAYFFHRQLYAMGILFGLPLFLLPIIVFLLSYYVQKTYDSIVKLI